MASDKSIHVLRAIWERLSKPGPAGKKFLILKHRNDIVYLYSTGFVDESQITLLDWVKAFEDSLQKDGSYLITEEQWMDKAPYHYSGPVGTPFDAMTLREGDWSEADMETLLREKILPATYFTESEFRRIFNEAKPTFFSGGVYKISPAVKKDLKELLELCPSPAQVRALGVLEARKQPAPSSPPTPRSGFASGPSQSEVAAQRLANLLSQGGKKK